MKQQIEIFTNDNPLDLQEDVNEFLEEYEARSVAITATDIGNEAMFMAVVKYQMPQRKKEKEFDWENEYIALREKYKQITNQCKRLQKENKELLNEKENLR